jgi:hypothetical protein
MGQLRGLRRLRTGEVTRTPAAPLDDQTVPVSLGVISKTVVARVTVGPNPTPIAGERPLARRIGRGPFSYPLCARHPGSRQIPAERARQGHVLTGAEGMGHRSSEAQTGTVRRD